MKYERLTKRICGAALIEDEFGNDISTFYKPLGDAIDRLAEFEDKKEQGTLIELPCKVGDTVYLPWVWKGTSSIAYLTVTHIIIRVGRYCVKTNFYTDDEDYWSAYNCGEFDFTDFGKTVFLTREEAEKRWKELQRK